MPLQPLSLPDDDWPGWLDERARGQVRLAGEQVVALKAAPAGDAVVLELWNDVSTALGNAFAVCSLLSSVHPDPEVVRLAEAIEVEAQAFRTDLYLDAEVHDRLDGVPHDGLDDAATRMLDDALLSFRRAGVDRDDDVRAQVRALDQRLTDLGQAFARNIRDGRRTTRVPASALAGMPDDFVEDHPVADDGTVAITTEYPDVHPFLTYTSDAEARHAVAASFFDLAYPENDAVLHDLLDARHEKATLLGYASWADYDAEVKMIGTGDEIAAFIDRISEAASDAGRAEIAVLEQRAARDGVASIDISNWRHFHEVVKREEHGVDAQEVRRYFSFAKVHDGLLATTGRLFGLEYVPVDRAEARTWHPDVSTYDVVLDSTHLGRIHLDLHPREGKYNHAAEFELVRGVAGRQLPEAVLVCNFPRGLMDHRDVVTVFHEFGHLMHHVLAGRHDWVRFSGVATEWDFVEAPSQMLEEWAWNHLVLREFATDADGVPIPEDLVERMRAAEDFGRAFLARTQMFYASISYRFHVERPADLTARMFELYDAYSLVRPIPESHFYAGFGHLGGYTSAYYTYMWSQVIAKDLLSAFDQSDPFATDVAHRYRDLVLAKGGSGDAADLVADFLGRPYDTRAFEAWLNRPAG